MDQISARLLGRLTGTLRSLPILTLMPHSRCNCRCLMCDIWRANAAGVELSAEQLGVHHEALQRLGVRQVVLSGGEALMHRDLWALCALLRPLGIKLTLLSTGLLLERHAAAVAEWCDEVIVSLDGPPAIHDAIRRVPRAYERLAAGIAVLQRAAPALPISARSVVQRANFAHMAATVATARELGLQQISFLPVDVSSSAFNRPSGWEDERVAEAALSRAECTVFAAHLEDLISAEAASFQCGFIAESPAKLRRMVAYFQALNGDSALPPVQCNAPWVSAVIEADGTVRPCFFHAPIGNLSDGPLDQVLNSATAVRFRRELDVANNSICQRCVCSLNLGLRERLR